MLEYLRNKLRKKLRKKKSSSFSLSNMLDSLVTELESQEGMYLFEFFSLAKHPEVAKSAKLVQAFASINSGNVTNKNVRQALEFISQAFENQFDQLVSLTMKYRKHILDRLTKAGQSFENKTELAEYLKLEKHVIIVHTLYASFVKFRSQMQEDKVNPIKLSENHLEVLNGILSFAETSLVTELSLNNLLRTFGIGTKDGKPANLMIGITKLFSKFPEAIFNDLSTQRQKVIDGLRQSMTQVTSERDKVERTFSFLKPRIKRVDSV